MLLNFSIMHLYGEESEAQATQQAAFSERKNNSRTVRDTLILSNCAQSLSACYALVVMHGNSQIGYCSLKCCIVILVLNIEY